MATLLVIDDDPVFLQEAEARLTEWGFTVLLALTGQQAMVLLDMLGPQVDLALVDLVMPLQSGIEVIREIKQKTPELRMIATSRNAYSEDAEIARYFGALDLWSKPITHDWAERLRKVIEGPPEPAVPTVA